MVSAVFVVTFLLIVGVYLRPKVCCLRSDYLEKQQQCQHSVGPARCRPILFCLLRCATFVFVNQARVTVVFEGRSRVGMLARNVK